MLRVDVRMPTNFIQPDHHHYHPPKSFIIRIGLHLRPLLDVVSSHNGTLKRVVFVHLQQIITPQYSHEWMLLFQVTFLSGKVDVENLYSALYLTMFLISVLRYSENFCSIDLGYFYFFYIACCPLLHEALFLPEVHPSVLHCIVAVFLMPVTHFVPRREPFIRQYLFYIGFLSPTGADPFQ
ncbi:unnamed protein product [Protopolystoma xenopodis]|uniref:Uncharacterized protein n=1 Tax=Protopolystoma xenopodis TaxID=117903 RepID=A0A448XIE0_9PLAT|nr:unnamed protein product [Protopolystoma xenopodis]